MSDLLLAWYDLNRKWEVHKRLCPDCQMGTIQAMCLYGFNLFDQANLLAYECAEEHAKAVLP